MKSLTLARICMIVGLSYGGIHASQGLFVTGVTCSTDCDNNSLYKNCDGDFYGKTFFSFRPQDSDSSRRILEWFNADHIGFDEQTPHYQLTVSPQYTRSFDSNQIARWFFFNGRDCMTVGIPDQYQDFDIDGSQIGLSLGTIYDPDTDSVFLSPGKIGTVWAKPVVENYIIDIDFWYDLSSWHENLWSRLECVIVNMKTNMHMFTSGKGNQDDEYPLGLFSLDSTSDIYGDTTCGATPVPYSSILCALEGNRGWGTVTPLRSGKFPLDGLSKWGVAGLHFDLGYDIYQSMPWFCAGSFHVVFPTGTRPKGTYVFEPVIGANKSWQVGATAIAQYVKEFAHSEFGIYFYAVGTHLFKSTQERVFSLQCNGAGSQLLLLKQFAVGTSGLVDTEREANIFCGKTKIGSTLMFDGSLMFQVSHKRLVVDVGYNYWARTREHRSKSVAFRGFYENAFGVKGDTPMENQQEAGIILCLPDSTTQSTATIASPTEDDLNSPVFIEPCDINYGSALSPTAMSHKVFGAIGFKSSWFILLSGEAEFGTNNAVINQWGLMLKVGKEF